MQAEDVTPERVTIFVACLVTLLFVIAAVSFTHSLSETGPRQQSPCQAARVAANSVPDREDTVDDEVEYRRLDALAEKICAG